MNLLGQKMLMMTAVVAIATAQLLGIQQGYICDCGGQVTLTQADHCHGPHTEECHDHELEDHSDEEPLQDHGPASDTNEHSEMVSSLLAKTQHVPVIQILSPVTQILPLSEWLLSTLQAEVTEQAAAYYTEADGIDPPPWPARLAHAISLRV